MNEVQQVLQKCQQTSGNLDKMAIIQNNSNLLGLMDVLQFIYNPYFKTGISGAKLLQAIEMAKHIQEVTTITYFDMMEYLKGHNTGSNDDLYQVARFLANNEQTAWLAKALVTQDLKIGLDVKSLNKIFGESFIPRVGCMLGLPYEDVTQVRWPCIITEKLDGIRRIMIKENGIVRLYSRSGHEDTGLIDIEHEAQYLPDNHVYDGELIAIGKHATNLDTRQKTSSLSSGKGNKTGLIYNIFDMVTLSEFYSGTSRPAIDRKAKLGILFGDQNSSLLFEDAKGRVSADTDQIRKLMTLSWIKALPILGYVDNFAAAAPIASEIWNRGGEGIMLNTSKGLYEIKRSKELLKVKQVHDITLKIEGFTEGTGKHEGRVGAILVKYKGQFVGVGSGLDDYLRTIMWDKQDEYIGKEIDIEHFGESRNAGGSVSLNCPIFKGFRRSD